MGLGFLTRTRRFMHRLYGNGSIALALRNGVDMHPSLRNGFIYIFFEKDVSLSKYFKMALKNLPLGISTLSKLLENNCIYVDKTE